MKKLFLLCLLFPHFVNAQKYLVLFKDKANSPYSISKPTDFLSSKSIARRSKQGIKVLERDLPPNPIYLSQLAATGGKIWYKSRWMNGAVVQADSTTLVKILKLSFVKGVDGNLQLKNTRQSTDNQIVTINKNNETFNAADLGASDNQLKMLGVDKMFAAGFHGEGMYVAVLDNGFFNANKLSFFSNLFSENRVLATFDFVRNQKNVYDTGDGHGTECLSCLAAYEDSKIIGTAYKANYALFATEDDASESRLEEANWLIAAEMADSLGVDVISTSLGYNEFDNSTLNYAYSSMNGHTALSTRAAEIAANVGILVVIAAGNEGSHPWKHITAPADADSVIAVGAVSPTGTYVSFSSLGPSFDGRVKPDLVAEGSGTAVGAYNGTVLNGSGTSFATPLLAGMATSYWQAFPNLTNMQVRDFLIKSASQYSKPDIYLGYGIPNFQATYDATKKALGPLATEDFFPKAEKLAIIYPNPSNGNDEIRLIINDSQAVATYELNLIDAMGKEIWTKTVSEKNVVLPISKSDLNGIYYLKISSKSLNTTLKVNIP